MHLKPNIGEESFCTRTPGKIWVLTVMPLVCTKLLRKTSGLAMRSLGLRAARPGAILATSPASLAGKWLGRSQGWSGPGLGAHLRRSQCRRAGTAEAGRCGRSIRNAGEGVAQPVQGAAEGVPTEPRGGAWRVGQPKKLVARKPSAGCPWHGGGGTVPVALRAAASLAPFISVHALGRVSRPSRTSATGQGMGTERRHGEAEYDADAIGRAARVGAVGLCAWGAWREGSGRGRRCGASGRGPRRAD
jgi:hypothetical protein